MSLRELNEQKQVSTSITFRILADMKADAIKLAASKGLNLSQWIAEVFAQALSDGNALTFDWDQQRTILIDNLKADKDKLSKQVAKLQTDLKDAKSEASKTANKAQKAVSKESKLLSEVNALKADLRSAQAKIKALEDNSSKSSAELQKHVKLNSQAAKRIKDDAKLIIDFEHEIRMLKGEIKELKTTAADLAARVDLANKIFHERRVKDRDRSTILKDVYVEV